MRSDRQRREIAVQVWARSTPVDRSAACCRSPRGRCTWPAACRRGGDAGRGGHAGRGPLVRLDHGVAGLAAAVGPGVDPAHGGDDRRRRRTRRPCRAWTSRPAPRPRPPTAPRHPLRRLELAGFSAVHEDGTVGVRDVDLTVERGQLVLVVGPVGSGKSSLLRALAGIVHHTGELRWNGQDGRPSRRCSCGPTRSATWPSCRGCCPARSPTTSGSATRWTPPARCRPPSWTTTWRPPAAGSALLIGHKGTRLSGGQLQRLALARALAPRTELLIADDVSSALDVTTELELWRALRDARRDGGRLDVEAGRAGPGRPRGRAASAARRSAQGTWRELEDRWGHLAG